MKVIFEILYNSLKINMIILYTNVYLFVYTIYYIFAV